MRWVNQLSMNEYRQLYDLLIRVSYFNGFCKKSPASIGGEMNCKYNLTSYLVYDKILLKRG